MGCLFVLGILWFFSLRFGLRSVDNLVYGLVYDQVDDSVYDEIANGLKKR